jgi:hypothetical protein
VTDTDSHTNTDSNLERHMPDTDYLILLKPPPVPERPEAP